MELNSIIGGLVIFVCIIIALIIRFKTKQSIYDKEVATNFLNGLSDTFYNKILEIIDTIDIGEYESFAEMEVDILRQIYDAIWEYTQIELEKASKQDIITAMALKFINKDTVIKLVDKIFDDNEVYDKLESLWVEDFKVRLNKLEQNESDIEESFYDKTQYNENFSDGDLDPATVDEPTEEELASLNPPSDQEKEYDPENDDSVEVIEDDVYLDKNGRRRSKTTGRFV